MRDSTAPAQTQFLKHLPGVQCKKGKTPCPNVGGPSMGGHVIPQCLVTDRITFKLQLTGKSRLISNSIPSPH